VSTRARSGENSHADEDVVVRVLFLQYIGREQWLQRNRFATRAIDGLVQPLVDDRVGAQ
jgi:hypothetical protein